MRQFVVLVVVFGLAAGQSPQRYNYDEYDNDFSQDDENKAGGDDKDYDSEPRYSFGYEVHDEHSGDIKSHYEERQGDHTQGMYSLVEPGGSKRVVRYFVKGKSGFNAQVQREESRHPHGPAPSTRGRYRDEPDASQYSSATTDISSTRLSDQPTNFGQRLNYKSPRKHSYRYRPKSEKTPMSSFSSHSLFNSFKNMEPLPQPYQTYQSHRSKYDSSRPNHATSSVKFITNGASLSTVTNHIMPEPVKPQYY